MFLNLIIILSFIPSQCQGVTCYDDEMYPGTCEYWWDCPQPEYVKWRNYQCDWMGDQVLSHKLKAEHSRKLCVVLKINRKESAIIF